MSTSLSADDARRLRLLAQRLDAPSREQHASVTAVAASVVGVQAQEWSAARLAIRARRAGVTASAVDAAREQERSVVRTWLMRGTLHLVAAEDTRWLLRLLGPIFAAQGQRRRHELGLDDDTASCGVALLRDALADLGPLTRQDIAGLLAQRGIPTAGQAAYHLIYYAALLGVLCYGPARAGQPAFVLLDDWLPPDREPAAALDRDAALARLARRYLDAFGPARPEDFTAWSGLTLRDARAAWSLIAADVAEVDVEGTSSWLLRSRQVRLKELSELPPSLPLLPSFDIYLLGYRDRSSMVPREHARRVHPGGGVIRPTLLVGGRVGGIWRTERRANALEVIVEPFEDLALDLRPALERDIADIGRFLGVNVKPVIRPSAASEA